MRPSPVCPARAAPAPPHTLPLAPRFSTEEISARTKLKSSAARAFRTQIVEQYPTLEPFIDSLMPKKSELVEAKG